MFILNFCYIVAKKHKQKLFYSGMSNDQCKQLILDDLGGEDETFNFTDDMG